MRNRPLTTGSISRHLLRTMSFMLVMMIFQTLYELIDLYWVGRLGTSAVAAVGIAGNLTFAVQAMTQMLAVGSTSVVARAVGRRDEPAARLAFNQSLVLAAVCSALFLGLAMRCARDTPPPRVRMPGPRCSPRNICSGSSRPWPSCFRSWP